MSFINWGGETPEQRALRAKLEQDALFEQAVRMANARNSVQVGGVGSGGPRDSIKELYGIAFNGLIYNLGSTEANWEYNYETFPDLTCAVLNPDDGFLYAVLEWDGEAYFIRIDRKTREFTFIDNNINDFSTKGASSLYYEGGGSFIYLDNCYKSTVSSIIRIELTGQTTATATEVSEVDSEEKGYLLRNLFIYEGSVWAVSSISGESVSFQIGPFDIETGDFYYSNQLLPSLANAAITQFDLVFSTIEHNGTLYSAIVYDGDEPGFGLFTIDTEYGGALAPYYATLVKDLFIESAEGVPIYSLVSF
jgi:hypothetical protein